jgi:hypothetical protein
MVMVVQSFSCGSVSFDGFWILPKSKWEMYLDLIKSGFQNKPKEMYITSYSNEYWMYNFESFEEFEKCIKVRNFGYVDFITLQKIIVGYSNFYDEAWYGNPFVGQLIDTSRSIIEGEFD